MLSLLSQSALALDNQGVSFLAPFGTIPAEQEFVFETATEGSHGQNLPGCEDFTGFQAVSINGNRQPLVGPLFSVDSEPVVCDMTADPPCLARENKPRPFLPTGVIYDPIRVNYDHMKATLRYDVIQVNADANTEEMGFVAFRGILALTNPTHVTRHADVGIVTAFVDDAGVDDTITIDGGNLDEDDFWVIQQAGDNVYLTYMFSPCTDDSHHFKVLNINNDVCAGGQGTNVASKVMVHSGKTSIVASITEVFPYNGGEGIEAARRRTFEVAKHGDDADLHWFGDLSDKERLSIVNFCVDDDDGETTDDDDSSSATDTSITTSDMSDGEFNFEFHEHRCDNPLYHSKERRYRDKFSSDFDTSMLYTSTVDRIEDTSTSSSSTSSGMGEGESEETSSSPSSTSTFYSSSSDAPSASTSSSSSSSSSPWWERVLKK